MVEYRFAQVSDENELTQLHLQYIDAKTVDNNFFELFQNTSDYLKRSLASGTCETVLAIDEGRIIGMGVIYYYESLPTLYNIHGFTANISDLSVTLNYRNQGIGGTILKMLLESANMRKAEIIFANTTSLSDKLFHENGFVSINNILIYQN